MNPTQQTQAYKLAPATQRAGTPSSVGQQIGELQTTESEHCASAATADIGSSVIARKPLFRTEVARAQHGQFLGGIYLAQPLRFTVIASTAVFIALALIAFAVWGEVTRKMRVPGVLSPVLGTLQLSAAAPGTVAERRVNEGDAVVAGQVLFVLHTGRATAEGDAAALVAAHLHQRQASLRAERSARELHVRQRQQALADRIRAIEREVLQAAEESALAERRVALARASVERLQVLVKEGFVAHVQVQAKQEELLGHLTRLEASRRSASALAREQQAVQAELTASTTQWQAEAAQLQRAADVVSQELAENTARKTLAVTASQAGTVTAVHVPLGAVTHAGQTLATLVPEASPAVGGGEGVVSTDLRGSRTGHALEAQLFAPSRAAGFVQPGQRVWMRLAAFPYQKFGMAEGQVVAVSRTPLNPQDLPPGIGAALMHAAQSQEPMYRITVALAAQNIAVYGKSVPLKPGMALDADVVQDRRAVWEWLLEPALAAWESKLNSGTRTNSPIPGG